MDEKKHLFFFSDDETQLLGRVLIAFCARSLPLRAQCGASRHWLSLCC